MIAANGFTLAGLDARIHLVWAVLLVALLAYLAERRRLATLRGLLSREGATRVHGATTRRRRVRLALLLPGLLLLVFASLQPRSNPVNVRAPAKVRDLAILLDVSRSMLAEDRKPNRLESVKLELARLSDRLSGDRVGLVAFAGDAVVVCPLTSNYSYFKRTLRNIGPRTAGKGGTKIGDAIRKAVTDLLNLRPSPSRAGEEPQAGETVLEDVRRAGEGRFADILLVTDGEDHESYPVDAVRSHLRPLGIGLYVVGVGSTEGRSIPAEDGPVRYRGEIVRSALQDKALRELVIEAGRGRYLPASVHHFDLVDFFEQAMDRDEGREVVEERVEWQEVYQPFLIAGLLVVLLAFAVPLRPVSGRRKEVAS